MVDLHRREPWQVADESIIERINALEQSLSTIPRSLEQIAMAAYALAGAGSISFQDGNLNFNFLTDEEKEERDLPSPRLVLGKTSTQHGTGGPLAWVLSPPAPYNDAEIVCSPDSTTPVGMRCHVVRKLPGGERKQFQVTFTEQEN